MLTAHPSTVRQKKDLHVGGLGSNPPANVHVIDQEDNWLDLAHYAETLVRTNPWTVVALVGMAGFAVGVALARRGSSP